MEAAITVEQQQQTEPCLSKEVEIVNESAKSQDFFDDNKTIGKNIQLHVLNLGISYLI